MTAQTIDLGSGPHCEDPAQLGSPKFRERNLRELALFKAAFIALHGPPPAGCTFVEIANPHDFGTYSTLALRIDAETETVDLYASALDAGIASWTDACLPDPSREDIDVPSQTLILRAMITARPNPDGTFALPLFARLWKNLSDFYPELAEQANQRLAVIHGKN